MEWNKIKLALLSIIFMNMFTIYSQGYNSDKIAFTNFAKRIYEKEECEGLKKVTDYDKEYLLVYIVLENNEIVSKTKQFRVAKIKATKEIASYTTGSVIVSENTINFRSYDNNEIVKENTKGFVNGVELLTHFTDKEKQVFIYCKEL